MDRKFQIGEIARFFDIPASTLRYWEDKGVLHPGKKSENQYREYTIEDLMTISDVIFVYRFEFDGIILSLSDNSKQSLTGQDRFYPFMIGSHVPT